MNLKMIGAVICIVAALYLAYRQGRKDSYKDVEEIIDEILNEQGNSK